MESSILKKAGEFLKKKSRHKVWIAVVTAMSLVVTLVTAGILMSPARAMVGETYCGMEEHEHTAECYERVLICGHEEEPEDSDAMESSESIQESSEAGSSEESVESSEADPSEEGTESGEADPSEENAENSEADPSEEGAESSEANPSEEGTESGETDPSEEGTESSETNPSEEGAESSETGSSEENAESSEADSSEESIENSEADPSEESTEASETDPSAEGEQNGEVDPSEGNAESDASAEEDPDTASTEEALTAAHVHDDSCYAEETLLTCETEETEGHTHTADCYTTVRSLICGEAEAQQNAGPEEVAEEVEPEQPAAADDNTPVESETADSSEPVESEAADSSEPTESETVDGDVTDESEAADNNESETADSIDESSESENEADSSESSEPEATEAPETEEPAEDEGGEEEAEPHVHTDECYMLVLACEKEEHKHSDKCYEDPETLVYYCDEDIHVHTDKCYDENSNLVCGYADFTVHAHTEDCYNARGELACPLTEIIPHVHTEECYGKAVDEDADTTAEDDAAEPELNCGLEETEDSHAHTDECYDENGELTCSEPEGHVHTEDCYAVAEEQEEQDEEEQEAEGPETEELVLICGLEELELEFHTHTDDCFDENGNWICGKLEILEHVHTDECKVEREREEFTYYCLEYVHEHEEECYDENGSLICGKADYAVHIHTKKCYGAEDLLICPLSEIEEHVHTEECYPDGVEEPACGMEEVELHTHTEECFDEDDNWICGKLEVLEHVHSAECKVSHKPITKTFENESFIITATYLPSAEIPEEAEFRAEQITEEGNEEHYAQRQEEYQEALGDGKATIRALLKIGFYVDGVEVEPETPVTITIQSLNESGLAEGKPITVIHFAEEGTELLEGSNVENGSTTFEMGSFSEIAVGYGAENVTVPVNEELKYGTEEFEVTFRIEGEVSIPIDGVSTEGDVEADASGEVGNDDTMTDNPEADSAATDGVVTVEIQTTDLDKKLEFKVEALDANSSEYAEAAAAYTEEIDVTEEDDSQLFLDFLSYGVTYDGQKLDLSDCVITAEIRPTQGLIEYAETALNPMTLELNELEKVPDEEIKPEVTIVVAELGEDVSENREAMVVGEASWNEPMIMTLNSEDGIMALEGTSQANPTFTVEFYAYIDMISDVADSETLRVIDTAKRDKNGNLTNLGEGGNLPTSAEAKAGKRIKKIKLDDEKKVDMTNELKEIYSSSSYNYISAPGLVYFNKIAKNPNYVLIEIRVQRENSEAWETYSCGENGEKEWHFTNKSKTQEENSDNFILITKNSIIQLVHKVKEEEVVKGNVNFYDYDISDGKLYTNYTTTPLNDNNTPSTVDRGKATTHNSGDIWYMYTRLQGINSMPGQTLGFGNSEGRMRTTLGEGYGNKAIEDHISYGKATFGLVTGMEGGKIKYADGIVAPNLFNEGNALGKTPYVGNLVFLKQGDTYTLTGAEVLENSKVTSSVSNLDQFKRQDWAWAAKGSANYQKYWFASNDFYPLDDVSSAGTPGHDLKFGESDTEKLQNFAGYQISGKGNNQGYTLSAPASDDGKNHNHYFGMHFTVDFDLVKDYIGPLEYLFYGDDDMWIFLDGPEPENTGRLICDIGGVHTSVGEYINLWDYIKQGSEGHYTLSFFYTERGASGSTCWMQFTIPSVSFGTTEQDVGQLKISKTVTGAETDEVFGFEVTFKDKNGNALQNDYSYTKYNTQKTTKICAEKPEGHEHTDECYEIVENDILIWNNSKFTLKADEYIVISFLPEDSYYTIKEVGPVTLKPKNPGEDISWTELDNPYKPEITGGSSNGVEGVVTGKITKNSMVKISYNNVLGYALPETGSTGTNLYTIAGAILASLGAGLLYRKKFRERRV